MNLKYSLIEEFNSFSRISYKKSKWKESKAFFIDNREIAHFENENSIDIRLTRKGKKNYQKTY